MKTNSISSNVGPIFSLDFQHKISAFIKGLSNVGSNYFSNSFTLNIILGPIRDADGIAVSLATCGGIFTIFSRYNSIVYQKNVHISVENSQEKSKCIKNFCQLGLFSAYAFIPFSFTKGFIGIYTLIRDMSGNIPLAAALAAVFGIYGSISYQQFYVGTVYGNLAKLPNILNKIAKLGCLPWMLSLVILINFVLGDISTVFFQTKYTVRSFFELVGRAPVMGDFSNGNEPNCNLSTIRNLSAITNWSISSDLFGSNVSSCNLTVAHVVQGEADSLSYENLLASLAAFLNASTSISMCSEFLFYMRISLIYVKNFFKRIKSDQENIVCKNCSCSMVIKIFFIAMDVLNVYSTNFSSVLVLLSYITGIEISQLKNHAALLSICSTVIYSTYTTRRALLGGGLWSQQRPRQIAPIEGPIDVYQNNNANETARNT